MLVLYRKGPDLRRLSKYVFQRLFCSGEASEERKGLILGVYDGDTEDPKLTPAAKKFNDKVDGKLLDLLKRCGCKLHYGYAKTFNNVDNEFWAVALVGLGEQKKGYNELEAIDEGLETARFAAGAGARQLMVKGVTRVLTEGLGHPEQAAEGAALALWRYQENKMREHWKVVPEVELFSDSDTDSFQRGLFKAESQNLARRLSDTPANLMTPLHFAQECVNELCPCGIKVEVHDRDWIEANKMNAFMAVARGSCEPPIVLEISYCGGGDGKGILMVGKGITFDSGGLCLKNRKHMGKYRGDMTGAAAIVGAIRSASALSLPCNINAVIALCENMPSGMAMRPGDIVMSMNGKSIRITHTDNEGRLTMADTLIYGQKTHKPSLVIDVASLTSGIKDGLGSGPSGVFCNTQKLWTQVYKAGVITGDRVWRMPLWDYYRRRIIKNPSCDLDNNGKEMKNNACTAAAFLNEFIDCAEWIHFDTTGIGMLAKNKLIPYYTKNRMTGRPTRTLLQLIYQLSCPSEGGALK